MVYPKGKVEDGTRCKLDPKNKDVCIKGKCRVSKVLVRFSSTMARIFHSLMKTKNF